MANIPSPLVLKLEAHTGAEFEDVIAGGIEAAMMLDLFVEIEINGCKVLIGPDDQTAQMVDRLHEALKRGAGFMSANVMPRGEGVIASKAKQSSEFVDDYQNRVGRWMSVCFGAEISQDKTERNHRFLEEALELVQSLGCTQSEAHQLVDYVFGRPLGEPEQEIGGVMVTLAALGLANRLHVDTAAERELARVWTKVEQIRAKHAAKPKHSPLPGPSFPSPLAGEGGARSATDEGARP